MPRARWQLTLMARIPTAARWSTLFSPLSRDAVTHAWRCPTRTCGRNPLTAPLHGGSLALGGRIFEFRPNFRTPRTS